MRLPITLCLMALASGASAADLILPPESRKDLGLTVYGGGFGLVWDQRPAGLTAGTNRLIFESVSRQMQPSSAMIEAAPGVKLVDIDYDFRLLTSEALLRTSLGKEVGVVRVHPTTGEETVDKATLLSVAGGAIVRRRDRVEQVDPGRLVFYDVAAELRPRPTLAVTVDSGQAGSSDVTLGYLTQGLGWSADYVALWNEAAGTIELGGRATLTNTSSTDFADAAIALIAGQVNRELPRPASMGRAMTAPMMAEAKAMPDRQEFADLQLYKVPGRISLFDQQTKQVTLVPDATRAVDRQYVSESAISAYREAGEPQPTHPQVRLRFANSAGSPNDKGGKDVAGPLPAGVVRVFAREGDGRPRLVGENRIEHTPVGDAVRLNPGEAFDITLLRRQTDFVQSGLPQGVAESGWSIEVRNARDKPATVRIVEVVPGDWTILAESAKHEKETADRLVWPVTAPAKGSVTLTYRIRTKQ